MQRNDDCRCNGVTWWRYAADMLSTAGSESFLAVPMAVRKRLALIAHDNRRLDLLDWARFNKGTLANHDLCATGTTGALLSSDL